MNKKTLLALMVGFLASSFVTAGELDEYLGGKKSQNPSSPLGVEKNKGGSEIKKQVFLPLDGVAVNETEDGKIIIVSTNGRFSFSGVTDLYKNRAIDSIPKATDTKYLRFEETQLKDTDVARIPMGNPALPLQARILVDPYCPACSRLLSNLMAQKDKIRVDILLTPVSSQKSINRALDLYCQMEAKPEKAREVLAQLIAPTQNILPQSKLLSDKCEGSKVMINTMSARLLSVRGLPAIWFPDGRVEEGIPNDLVKALTTKPINGSTSPLISLDKKGNRVLVDGKPIKSLPKSTTETK